MCNPVSQTAVSPLKNMLCCLVEQHGVHSHSWPLLARAGRILVKRALADLASALTCSSCTLLAGFSALWLMTRPMQDCSTRHALRCAFVYPSWVSLVGTRLCYAISDCFLKVLPMEVRAPLLSCCFAGYLSEVLKIAGPFLVVVPLSTVPNWIKEFRKWTPQLNALVYVGDSKSREVIRTYEFYNQRGASRPYRFEVHQILAKFCTNSSANCSPNLQDLYAASYVHNMMSFTLQLAFAC